MTAPPGDPILHGGWQIIPAMAQGDFAKAAPLIEQAAKKYR
jgi:hypothetical protein